MPAKKRKFLREMTPAELAEVEKKVEKAARETMLKLGLEITEGRPPAKKRKRPAKRPKPAKAKKPAGYCKPHISRKTEKVSARAHTALARKVWKGDCKRTAGGLEKEDLVKNKRGTIVSRKRHAAALKGPLRSWVDAAKSLGYFKPGTFTKLPKKGTAAYAEIRKAYRAQR